MIRSQAYQRTVTKIRHGLVVLSLLVLVGHFVMAGLMTQSDSTITFLAFSLGFPLTSLLAFVGILLCFVKRSPSTKIYVVMGLGILALGTAWFISCASGRPYPIRFGLTGSYDFDPTDECVIRSADNRVSVVAPRDLAQSVYESLHNAQLLMSWEGSQIEFVCEFRRDGEILFECELMSSGNFRVGDRLFLGSPELGDFLDKVRVESYRQF